ncbi:hypothetical protein [Cerasicoccus frondis]|uniref:hypothetical protein n=1 Tax=Cerasicoccus frondis TaxID=490090 RepID=UPI0028527A75|nr:hypothetical protein [Cerasicoccus frondis]
MNIRPLKLPTRSLNLNAFADGLSDPSSMIAWNQLILIDEGSVRRAIEQYLEHYHSEQNHQD